MSSSWGRRHRTSLGQKARRPFCFSPSASRCIRQPRSPWRCTPAARRLPSATSGSRVVLVLSFGSVGKTSCSRLISPFWMNDQASLRDTSPLHGSAGLYVSPERERKYTTNEFGRKIDTCVIAKLSGDAPLDLDGSEASLIGFFARRTKAGLRARPLTWVKTAGF